MLTLPWKHFKCYKAQPFPAPYEKITTVPKVVKKKIPKGYGLCCLTIMFAVSMYKLMWFSPSTDSEVVTALGWGCVHVTELRRGQVVCLEDGGTLRLLSQVPGLVRWGRLPLLLLKWLEALCLALAEAQAWPSVVVVAVAALGWEGMGCALCLGYSHWDWGTPPVQPADQHQGRQVGQTLSASPEGDSGWLGVRSKAQAAG